MQSVSESYELRHSMPNDTSLPSSRNQYEDDSYAESSTLLDNEPSEELLSSEWRRRQADTLITATFRCAKCSNSNTNPFGLLQVAVICCDG